MSVSVLTTVVSLTILTICTAGLGLVAWASGAHPESSTRTAVVLGARLSGFGALWVVQFILLDRFLFARRVAHVPAESVALTRS